LAQAALAHCFTCALASAPLPVSAYRPGGPKMPGVAAVLLAAASLGLARGAEPVSAAKICIENSGAFVLSFKMQDTAQFPPMGSGAQAPWSTAGEQSCQDMSSIPDIEEGHTVMTFVYLQWGTAPVLRLPPVTYSLASGRWAAASFTCSGNDESDVDCELSGGARRLQNLI